MTMASRTCPDIAFVQENYRGDILHSVDYSAADKWRGKRGIVVGTANTGRMPRSTSRMVAADYSVKHMTWPKIWFKPT